MAGLKYWIWLSECKGLTNRSRALLLDHFGSPEDAYYADAAEYALVEGLVHRGGGQNSRRLPAAGPARADDAGRGLPRAAAEHL